VIKIFYYLTAVFCFVLAGLSIYDWLKYKKTKETSGLLLQLPENIKKRIHGVIGGGLREKKGRGLIDLGFSSFLIGCLVSLLEAACTSQVYVPTIVFILQNYPLKIKALSYLLLYNLMFVMPLVVIFLLSLLGVSSKKFNSLLRNNLGAIKIIMAAIFFVLGLLLIWGEIVYALTFYYHIFKNAIMHFAKTIHFRL
ncbi:MAG: hypothetical protein PHQ96_08250, partial [Candidatus Omnitrophica bacterium]|nr:hypothetical protein [Candidatus Omnitrophota bacterium]